MNATQIEKSLKKQINRALLDLGSIGLEGITITQRERGIAISIPTFGMGRGDEKIKELSVYPAYHTLAQVNPDNAKLIAYTIVCEYLARKVN